MSQHHIRVVDLRDSDRLRACFRVFSALRPHLNESTFIQRVQAQAPEGYTIACIEVANEVAAAAGFRVAHYLAWGKVLYIDDLVTHPERRTLGLGGALMDWLAEEGRRLECDEVHLDSGYQRHDAHRLYLNKGMILASHHFSRKL